MKINFHEVTVVGLIEMAGSLTYIQLVSLGKEHGIGAVDVFSQVQQALEEGKVKKYIGRPGTPAQFQDPRRGKPVEQVVTEAEVAHVARFIASKFKKRKFRAGDVARGMNEDGLRWYSGEEEKDWTSEKVGPCLKALAKEKKIIAGKVTSKGLYFWFEGWKPKENV